MSVTPSLKAEVADVLDQQNFSKQRRLTVTDFFLLLLLTFGSLLVAGYHPWAEDSEIYLPGVEKILQPQLFPFNAQFFLAHQHSTIYPDLVAESVKLSHLPLEYALFAWQLVAIFLFLLACWELSRRCFTDPRACWAGVALVAALLTLPVAGTALYIIDQYPNPRNLAAFLSLFAIVRVLDKKYVQAGLILVLTAAIHPLMSAFAIFYCGLLLLVERFDLRASTFAAILPFGLSFDPPSPAYHYAALREPFHYITRWRWYELLGALAPLAILWGFSHLAKKRRLHNLDLASRALIVYELICLPPALMLSVVPRLESLARLQPMRSLFLLYILMFLFGGCLLGEYVLKNHIWRWLLLFVPLCTGMFLAQRALFPMSAHIEWPAAAPRNPWLQAFVWIRNNAPNDAVFALNPEQMELPGADEQGFRAAAQRSMLADSRDGGAASMFPELADEWWLQMQARRGWTNFQLADFQRLASDYGASWFVIEQPQRAGLDCPYQNATVLVCRIRP